VSTVAALVVAAGRGSRFGSARPKQYLSLGSWPILRYSLAALAAHPRIDIVKAVIHPDDAEVYATAARGLDLAPAAHGGDTRQDSVRRGLESLADDGVSEVLIHDGARPFIDADLIDRVIAGLDGADGAIPGVQVVDTLKHAPGGRIAATVPRADLWRAQTPQGFGYAAIRRAHAEAITRNDLTDDAQVAEAAGLDVVMVQGAEDNMKITTQDDREHAERHLGHLMETRVGQGFDVHAFAETPGPVRLCGVDIPHDHGLAGHSDADVGLHVIVDAILGALAEGDIGQHFPPSDPQWKAADSAAFVTHARDLAADRGARIVNVDVTLICERPKLGAHREAMTERVAALLGIGRGRVSVKATTTERLGFTGRREGIAGQAVVTLQVPPDASPA
jgi:2-C-methyl-D-erythritol 4-phosphate cytidylyltransferase/2-C-methyl-D-erythritol 2,4-cyclodiphosphate synthase